MRKKQLRNYMLGTVTFLMSLNLTGCITIQTSPQPSGSVSVETVEQTEAAETETQSVAAPQEQPETLPAADPRPVEAQVADGTKAVEHSKDAAVPQTVAESRSTAQTAAQTAEITAEQAKTYAYQHAGVSADAVQYCKVDTDWEHGSLIYEVDFVANGMEYDYDINSAGIVMKWDIERAD